MKDKRFCCRCEEVLMNGFYFHNSEVGICNRCVLDCIKAINRRIKVRKRVSCCFRITEKSERKNAKCWNKRSSGWC